MKMTLLELVQSILSDMVSDDVTSIADTPESLQVASTIRDVYYQLVTNQTIPEHQALKQLTSAGVTAKVFMQIPATVQRIESIKYNKIKAGDTDNVFSDMITNDAPPTYWTSFDDDYICFDSYDAAVDASGLVGTKTLCWATVTPTTWAMNDTFVPDIDDNFFPLLLAEAKSTCFMNLKQQANGKVDKQARNQKVALQNDKHRTAAAEKASTGSTGPNYGRRGYSSSRNGLSGSWKYGP